MTREKQIIEASQLYAKHQQKPFMDGALWADEHPQNSQLSAADSGMVEEIIINLKRVEQDYRIDLTKEMEWLRNIVKKESKL